MNKTILFLVVLAFLSNKICAQNELDSANNTIYETIIPPEYPGGVIKFHEFIEKNLKYPKSAQDSHIKGTVYLYAVIETDGSLSNIKIIRKLHPLLVEEAIRLVSIMPKWVPGYNHNYNPVRVQQMIPIDFKIDNIKIK